ncbi:unnamed protein product [Diamesa hyperborea]
MKITLSLIAILIVAADSMKQADYVDEGDPRSYSNEEVPGNESDNDDYNEMVLDDAPNIESQITDLDVNDEYVTKIVDQTIDEININEDPKYEKKEVINALKEDFAFDDAVMYRIHATLTVQEVMVTCDFVVLDKQTEEKLFAKVDCDNDRDMEIVINKIES